MVNYCDFAATNLGYSDSGCITDHAVVDSVAQDLVFNTKTVSRYFNPNSFLDSGEEMDYTQAIQKSARVGTAANQIAIMDFKVH